VDAANGSCLGLVAGSVYTRHGRIETPHIKRPFDEKQSRPRPSPRIKACPGAGRGPWA